MVGGLRLYDLSDVLRGRIRLEPVYSILADTLPPFVPRERVSEGGAKSGRLGG